MGDLSQHFSRAELACHHCGRLELDPGLLPALERLRAIVGRPMRIVSGYRCPVHNRQVHGARSSRHLAGAAVDPERGYCTIDQARAAGFVGVGTNRGSVVHIDLRPGAFIRFADPANQPR